MDAGRVISFASEASAVCSCISVLTDTVPGGGLAETGIVIPRTSFTSSIEASTIAPVVSRTRNVLIICLFLAYRGISCVVLR